MGWHCNQPTYKRNLNNLHFLFVNSKRNNIIIPSKGTIKFWVLKTFHIMGKQKRSDYVQGVHCMRHMGYRGVSQFMRKGYCRGFFSFGKWNGEGYVCLVPVLQSSLTISSSFFKAEHQNLIMATLVLVKSDEQRRFSKLKEEDRKEDLISELPNAILQHILSFLPTRDIIRTSILCKTWKNLWTAISNIDLGDSIDITKRDYLNRRASFLDSLERILLRHDESDIERLRLSFKMPVNPTRLHSWILVAIKHNIRKLDVVLPLGCIYSLPRDLLTCESLTELRLYMTCIFNPSLIHWPNLKELHLSQVAFFNGSSTQIFSSIPLLQNLALVNCEWENIRHLSISVPNLRCLLFKQCSDPEDLLECEILVRASNLVYLNCMSNFSVNLLVSACLLANASVDVYNYDEVEEEVSDRSIRMLNGIKSVRSLTISDDSLASLSGVRDFSDVPVFQNLIRLKIVRDMSRHTIDILLDLMQRTPNLRILEIAEGLIQDIEFILNEDDRNFEIIPCCLRSHLKVISMKAIYGQEAPVHLLRHFLKHSADIQKVVVYYPNNASDYMEKREEFENQLHMLPRISENCVIEVSDRPL
ncbi:unnamed protein product [Fraxinus pennsylvanica]|uniref:F-box domain-containing protein n=1 Tax=Fraxinus pennsylvanica TaxID=56036 RepID=A0AAD2EBA0_9LAMI|nr:unnamed protein product [Fraxinus pennsylvanica]